MVQFWLDNITSLINTENLNFNDISQSQKQIQNVVIQAMGFTPGFDAYGKAVLQDAAGYKPYAVYTNQKNIENRATLRMFGGTDKLHNEMIESQYKGN